MPEPSPSLRDVLRVWGRIGCLGFGGPPAHVAMLREECVRRRGWLADDEFEDGVAATNLLPGPASTQLAVLCAWRLSGPAGALAGGLAFVLPGLALIIALAALFLGSPPDWVRGVGAGAGAAVAAVAVRAGLDLLAGSRAQTAPGAAARWTAYLAAGALAGAFAGPWVVLVLLGCGGLELVARGVLRGGAASASPLVLAAAAGGAGALAWTALKVGALSYGGGFVIIPLMRDDAVDAHRWMTDGEFLNAVALGQATPGPVVHTVAVVGYAAHGLGGALLAALLAFAPSFAFVLLGAGHFDRLRRERGPRAFLAGAGPAAVGAIFGVAVPLAAALGETWQVAVLAGAALSLLVLRRAIVPTLLVAAVAGAACALAGAPLPP